jgi:hypothetical protein
MRAIGWILSGFVIAGVGCSSPQSTPAPASTAAPAATATPGAAAPAEPGAPAAQPGATSTAVPAATPAPARPTSSVGAAPAASTPTSSAASTPGAAAPTTSAPVRATPPPPPAPTYREVTIPSGTTLAVELRTAVASNTSAVEDRVQGVLRRPIVVDGEEIVPAGAALSGIVTEAVQSARVKGRARLALRFTSLTIDDTPTTIGTAAIAREAEGTKKEDAGKIGLGAGAGAAIGAITGGKKGAVVGTIVGGGAGTGVVLATRGDEVALASGTALTTTLTRPVVVQVLVR